MPPLRLFGRIFHRNISQGRVVNQDVVMNVFDRQTKLLQKKRAAARSDAQLYDYLKDEVGYRLTDRLYDIKRTFKRGLELGCGRGGATKNITADVVEKLILTDLCDDMAQTASPPDDTGVTVECRRGLDEDQPFPFESDSLDLVLSNLSLHWVNNLPSAFREVARCLRNDGAFLGSLFGGDTLFELRSALQLAESERCGGISSHVSPFVDVRDLGGLLSQAGFTLLTIDADEIVIRYPSMFELMWDLRGMAENGCTWRRSLHLSKDVQFAASAIYHQLYSVTDGDRSGVPATFQIYFFLAWKPDPSQQKPAKRGSGTVSLADLENISKTIGKNKPRP